MARIARNLNPTPGPQGPPTDLGSDPLHEELREMSEAIHGALRSLEELRGQLEETRHSLGTH